MYSADVGYRRLWENLQNHINLKPHPIYIQTEETDL